MRRTLALFASLCVLTGAVSAGEEGRKPGAPEPVTQPLVQAGPFLVAVQRISQTRSVSARPQKGGPAAVRRRSVQLALAVTAPDPEIAARLAVFQVDGLTVEVRGRPEEVPHYGGRLENLHESAVLRAYIHIPDFPARARAVRSLYGEIVAFEKSGPLTLEIPLAGDKLPRVVEQQQVRATVRELKREGATVRLVMTVETLDGGSLQRRGDDGGYGVTLYDGESRAVRSNGGSLAQPRASEAEYRLSFQDVQGDPAKLRVQVGYRGGPRRVHRFRLEQIPIPLSPTGGLAGEPHGQK